MIGYDRYFIGPTTSGIEKNLQPLYTNDSSFTHLEDAYVFRGRVKKRFGETFLGRLRISLGNTDGSGILTGTVPGATFAIGQGFSVGSAFLTVIATGTPANLLSTNGGTNTYNTTSGAVAINLGASFASTTVYFYTSTPVMGLTSREVDTVNSEDLIGFDTQFSYRYTGGTWARLGSATTGPATAIWTGGDTDFFWTCNYQGASGTRYMFAVNNVAADQIQYLNAAGTWAQMTPSVDGTNNLYTGLIILPFKDRLIVLNSKEGATSGGATNYYNRCRFSQNGNPLVAADATAWRQDIPGKGGFLDAATAESITSAEFIKDRLIVFFERSTWELVYTGNEILPFRWQKINTELGAESPFSSVPFDKAILSVGNVGVHACNGVNVERVDENIPDKVFEIHNGSSGPKRVYGIRDYYHELVYWTFPSDNTNPTYPNNILVYNYVNSTWAIFNDSFTCFGYYQPSDDTTWATLTSTWGETSSTWTSGVFQSAFRKIVGGNQQGYVLLLEQEENSNDRSLQITNISVSSNVVTLTIINHNLKVGSDEDLPSYIYISGCVGINGLNGNIYQIATTPTVSTLTFYASGVTGSYLGSGEVTRVSNLDIRTKYINPYTPVGDNVYLAKVDFYVSKTGDATEGGEVTVDYYISGSEYSTLDNSSVTGALLGTGVLQTHPYATIPFETQQDYLWHAVYFQASGESVQLRLYMSDEQMRDTSIVWQDFDLNGMVLYTQKLSRLQ